MKIQAIAAMLLTFGAAALLISQPAVQEQPGPLRGGKFLLNSGWVLEPAGTQIPLDTFPMSSVLAPGGKHLLVMHGGYKPPSIHVLDAKTLQLASKVMLPDAWLGMTFSPGGLLYASGGSRSEIYEFRYLPNEGKLELTRTFPITPPKERKVTDFTGDVQLSPDGRLIYAAMLHRNEIAVINPQSGMVIERWQTGPRPYRILFHPDGQSFFVSSWAGAAVYQHATDTGRQIGMVRTGPHPTDMLWRDRQTGAEDGDDAKYTARIFVTASNTNNVNVLGINSAKTLTSIETINVGLYPVMPAGMTPSALAMNPAKNKLFVVCSDANAVAVVDIATPKSRVEGFIPSGWYPLAARVLADGRLLIFNGRGTRSFPNPKGPNPSRKAAPLHEGVRTDEYVGVLQTGTMSVLEPFDQAALDGWTQKVIRNSRYTERQYQVAHENPVTPLPQSPADAATSPIEHVIYIIKENRTYDQVLGDLGVGNGDPSLTLFGEKISPNHHKLAREFVTLDNFYVNADVSADGHNWSMAGIAPDYVQKMWPNSYAGRRKHYDYEGGEIAARPPAGYLWTSVLAKGLTMRNYGYFTNNLKETGEGGRQVGSLRDPSLTAVTNLNYRGFDLDYLDVNRAAVFIEDLKKMEGDGKLPKFILLRLGNDHTSGTTPGKYAPLSQMADNDYALGQIVAAVSASKFWAKTAIFVLEDDAQNGPDHVDSHRSPAFVISPYIKRGVVDHTMYNTASMLRTMELILGLNPMTMFDAAARPMDSAFQLTPDLKPYTAEKPRIAIDERNATDAPKAAQSRRMNFAEADDIDDDALNEILWVAIRGTQAPSPVRSIFSR